MNVLRPYKNPVIAVRVRPSWVEDVDHFCRFLAKQAEGFNSTWARARRMCLLAFADYYGAGMPVLRTHFNAFHKPHNKYPTRFDFPLPSGRTIKIAPGVVNERNNIGPQLTCRVTENALKKGIEYNSIYIMATYNVSMVYFIGWETQEELRQKPKENNYYSLREGNVHPMYELEVLHQVDRMRWYR